jgi:hypothetical protein
MDMKIVVTNLTRCGTQATGIYVPMGDQGQCQMSLGMTRSIMREV